MADMLLLGRAQLLNPWNKSAQPYFLSDTDFHAAFGFCKAQSLEAQLQQWHDIESK